MRKFTKEITALLATAAVSASIGAASVLAEDNVRTAGFAVNNGVEYEPEYATTTATIGTETMPTMTTTVPQTTTGFIGTEVYSETSTTLAKTTTKPATTPTIGTVTMSHTTTTTTKYTHTIGTMTTAYKGTTTTTTEIPPLMGTSVMTTTTTTEEIPPLMGDVAPCDNDLNGDGDFNVSDVVVFKRYLLNAPKFSPFDWRSADLCPDGELNVFDLILMKRELLNQKRYNDTPVWLLDEK